MDTNKVEADVAFWIATKIRNVFLLGGKGDCNLAKSVSERPPPPLFRFFCKIEGVADLFKDNNGKWWVVHLGIRRTSGITSNIGRETFLTPIEWEDGWPYVKNNRKASMIVDADIDAVQKLKREWRTDFNNTEWEKEWMFLRKPHLENYERGGGCLRLKPSTVKITDASLSPTFAAVRRFEIDCVIDTEMEFDTYENGDEAGAVVYLAPDYSYRICKRKEEDGNYILVEKTAEDFVQTAYTLNRIKTQPQ